MSFQFKNIIRNIKVFRGNRKPIAVGSVIPLYFYLPHNIMIRKTKRGLLIK